VKLLDGESMKPFTLLNIVLLLSKYKMIQSIRLGNRFKSYHHFIQASYYTNFQFHEPSKKDIFTRRSGLHKGLGSSVSTLPRVASDEKRTNSYINYDAVSNRNGVFKDLVIQSSSPNENPNSMTAANRIQTIDTIEKARNALAKMNRAPAGTIFACDTEVSEIDLKTQGPVGNGRVICISIYAGEEFDFGLGPGKALWIDNIDEAEDVLLEFKAWFENTNYKKIWHNYGFDRHVLANMGIECKGFVGDTMHMARLLDTSRDKASNFAGAGYSLESLSISYIDSSHQFDSPPRFEIGSQLDSMDSEENGIYSKTKMKDLFGVAKKKKDGEDSKIKEIPDVIELQRNPETRSKWIEYSAKDAMATWHVHDSLRNLLSQRDWVVDNQKRGSMFDFYQQFLAPFGELLTEMEKNGIRVDKDGLLKRAEESARAEKVLMEQRFRSWLQTQCVVEDPNDLDLINIGSTTQMQQLFFGHYEEFEKLASDRVFKLEKSPEVVEKEKQDLLRSNPYAFMTSDQLKAELKSRQLKLAGKKGDLIDRLKQWEKRQIIAQEIEQRFAEEGVTLEDLKERCYSRGLAVDAELSKLTKKKKKKATKKKIVDLDAAEAGDTVFVTPEEKAVVEIPPLTEEELQAKQWQVLLDMYITSEMCTLPADPIDEEDSINSAIEGLGKKVKEVKIRSLGLTPKDFTPGGVPAVSAPILKKMAGKNVFSDDGSAVWGTAYDFFGGGEAGKEACRAIGALAAVGQIDATITNFLVPLQALADKNNRIHCSLNLNTETGRLSSRRPNLQNQPALEKDQYKIRDAFVAEEGNTFIVADYGQLELRLLAHITHCESMIAAFKAGGCFHSRTAVGMYPHIKEAVESGAVLLEWDYSKGQPTVPLVKDTYASERRKAKTLNFSIAYGKTVHGLAQDWGISTQEAELVLKAWYADRPEVLEWQRQTQAMAKSQGCVRTLLGRHRHLPKAQVRGPEGGRAMRAAINTPIQGSAADVVMLAMLRLWRSEKLKSLGWKLLLQIHDEVIVEGPKESRDEAMKEVRDCMENPFVGTCIDHLSVHLDVDAKSADSWYKAK